MQSSFASVDDDLEDLIDFDAVAEVQFNRFPWSMTPDWTLLDDQNPQTVSQIHQLTLPHGGYHTLAFDHDLMQQVSDRVIDVGFQRNAGVQASAFSPGLHQAAQSQKPLLLLRPVSTTSPGSVIPVLPSLGDAAGDVKGLGAAQAETIVNLVAGLTQAVLGFVAQAQQAALSAAALSTYKRQTGHICSRNTVHHTTTMSLLVAC